jgi:ATP/maltotriose-dependent transcriptional regulator MalT
MERIGVTGWPAILYHVLRAFLHMGRGELDAAARHVASVERLAERDIEGEFTTNILAVKAQLAVYRGQPATVRSMVDGALDSLGERDQWAGSILWTHYWTIRAEADVASLARRRGRELEVREAVASAARHLVQMHSVIGGLPPIHWERRDVAALVATAEAELARARGDDHPDLWARAADTWAAARPLEHLDGYARWRAGSGLLATGGAEGRAAAKVQLTRALEIARALGAAQLRSDVERVTARAHLSLTRPEARPAAAGDGTELTPREREVLELVAAGHSNREIGEALFIAEKTASVHVSNLLGKLGVARRTEAVAVARERGLLAGS